MIANTNVCAYLYGLNLLIDNGNRTVMAPYNIAKSTDERINNVYIPLSSYGRYLIRVQTSNTLNQFGIKVSGCSTSVIVRLTNIDGYKDVVCPVNTSIVRYYNDYRNYGTFSFVYSHTKSSDPRATIYIKQHINYDDGRVEYNDELINIVSVLRIS